MAYEEGDWTVPELTVDPYDGSTVATLDVVDPGAVATPLTPATTDGGHTWKAPSYQLTAPGEWVERWTVTGTGKSAERRVLLVAPEPTDAPSGQRVYATTADYARALHAAPPAGSRKALAEASRAVEDMLFTAVYPVDALGMPTDAEHIAALRDATCAQAEDAKAYASRLTGSFTIGRLQVSKRPPAAVSKERYRSPRALQILRDAGLTGHEPWAR